MQWIVSKVRTPARQLRLLLTLLTAISRETKRYSGLTADNTTYQSDVLTVGQTVFVDTFFIIWGTQTLKWLYVSKYMCDGNDKKL